MAGDNLQMGVNYYVHSSPNNTPPVNSLTQTMASLLAGLLTGTTATSGTHSFAGTVGSSSGSSYAGINSFLTTDRTYPHSNLPKAYLNYVFFDENFNYIPYDATTGLGSYGVQIEMEGDAMNVLNPTATAPKNGYAFVYVSNESDVQAVYFDNLAVVHTRSKLLEEATYYPFGLKIAALSAQAFQKPTAPDKFQGDYSDYEEETGWNDFELRSYDPQIGRWLQIDPYDEFASPYLGMGNDWANNVDEDGGSIGAGVAMTAGTVLGFTAPYIVEKITGNHIENKGLFGLAGAFVGAGVGYGVGASVAGEGGFINNVVAFYDGLLGLHIGDKGSGEVSLGNHLGCGLYNSAVIPDIWGWVPSINIPIKIGSYEVDKWVTVLTRIIDPKDFIDNPHNGGSAYPDPAYDNNNIYRFDYYPNSDPRDQNNRTRTTVTAVPGKNKIVPNGDYGRPVKVYDDPKGPICGTNKGKRLEIYYENANGYPAGEKILIPNINYKVRKEKLVTRKGIYIKFKETTYHPFGLDPAKAGIPCK